VITVPGIGRVSGLIAALALAGSAQAQSSPLPSGVERAAHTYITRAALENFDGMIEDAQLAMLSAWLTAQADAMPAWKPGDEFEAARKRALAAAGGS
jgi:hypothetical protein